MENKKNGVPDEQYEGKDEYFMDIDRMINEGLGGGRVTDHNGTIEQATEIAKESPPLHQKSE